jgi:proteasome alpha subunit
VGTAIAGLHADARKLIDQARVQAQINRLSYDEPVSIQSLVVNVCDTKQLHTQYGGVRPFGVALLVAGVDDLGPQLFSTDPSGSYWGWKATAIGKDSDTVREFFAEKYKPDINLDGALKLAIEGVLTPSGDKNVSDPAEKAKTIEIGRVDTTKREFKILPQDEVEAILAAFA